MLRDVNNPYALTRVGSNKLFYIKPFGICAYAFICDAEGQVFRGVSRYFSYAGDAAGAVLYPDDQLPTLTVS